MASEGGPPPAPEHAGAREVFRVFLRLGVTSFGGPIAHIGYFREEFVARRRWISDTQYAELVALCQFLPGPASSQVGFALGLRRAGPMGALAAWVAFTMPSALVLVLAGLGLVSLGGVVGDGVLMGLKAVAVAVVAHAVWGMARTLIPDVPRMLIAVTAAGLALALPGVLGQLGALAVGLGAGLLWRGEEDGREAAHVDAGISRRTGLAALGAYVVLLLALPVLTALTQDKWVSLADAFYRAGALVFGGGHVVLPLLQGEPVIAASISQEQFLAGYSAAQAIPGPLFTLAAPLGFAMEPAGAAPAAAALALVAIFLPGLLLVVAALPYWELVRTHPVARSAMAGANAAVVGILLAAWWTPIITTGITGLPSLVIALGCVLLLVVWKRPAWIAVLVGALAGAVVGVSGMGLTWGQVH